MFAIHIRRVLHAFSGLIFVTFKLRDSPQVARVVRCRATISRFRRVAGTILTRKGAFVKNCGRR